MDTWIVFRMTSQQTKESGTYQLESISGKLQGTISDAETLTLELALEAGRFIENKEKLKEFLYAKKEALINQKNGVINVFMAGEDWMIIPDFDIPNNLALRVVGVEGAVVDAQIGAGIAAEELAHGPLIFGAALFVGNRLIVIIAFAAAQPAGDKLKHFRNI